MNFGFVLVLLLMSALHGSRSAPPSLREKRGVEANYGGWRPILPGSPFFFGSARSLPVQPYHPGPLHQPQAHENVHVHNIQPLPQPQHQVQQVSHQVNIQALPFHHGGQQGTHQVSIQALQPHQGGQHVAHQVNLQALTHTGQQLNIQTLPTNHAGPQGGHEVNIQALPPLPENQPNFHHEFSETKHEEYPGSPVPDKDIFAYYPPPTTPQPYKNHNNQNRPLYVERPKKPFEFPFSNNVPVLEIGLQSPFNVVGAGVHGEENLAQSSMPEGLEGHGGQNNEGFHQLDQVRFYPATEHHNIEGFRQESMHHSVGEDGDKFQQIGDQNGFQRFPNEEHAGINVSNGLRQTEGVGHDQDNYQQSRPEETSSAFRPHQEGGGSNEDGIRDENKYQETGGHNEYQTDSAVYRPQHESGDSQNQDQSIKEENKYQQFDGQNAFETHNDDYRPQERPQGQSSKDEEKFQQIDVQDHYNIRPGDGSDGYRPNQSSTINDEQRVVSHSVRNEHKYQEIRDHNGYNARPFEDQRIRVEDMYPNSGNQNEYPTYDGAGYHQHPEDVRQKEEHRPNDNQRPQPDESTDYRPQVDSYHPQHLPQHYPLEQQSSGTGEQGRPTVQNFGPEYVRFPGERGQDVEIVQLKPPSSPSPVYRPPSHHEFAVPTPTYSPRLPPSYSPPVVSYHSPSQQSQEHTYQSYGSATQGQEERHPDSPYKAGQPETQEQQESHGPAPPPSHQSFYHQSQPQQQYTYFPSPAQSPQPSYNPTDASKPEQPNPPATYHSYSYRPTATQSQPTESQVPTPPQIPEVSYQQPKEHHKTSASQKVVQQDPNSYVQVINYIPTVNTERTPLSTSTSRPTVPPRAEPLSAQLPQKISAPPSFHVYGAPPKTKTTSTTATTSYQKEASVTQSSLPQFPPPRAEPIKEQSEVIHMSSAEPKKNNGTQVYHAYYAPADHKAPPGYVRLTVNEFNKMFNEAEIQYVGSETASQKTPNNDKPKVLVSSAPENNKVDDEDDDGPVLTLDLKPGQTVEDALSELGTIDVGGVRVDASQLKEGRDFEVVDVSPVNGTAATTTATAISTQPSLLVDDGQFGERLKKKS